MGSRNNLSQAFSMLLEKSFLEDKHEDPLFLLCSCIVKFSWDIELVMIIIDIYP
jgi:hypothetical protein